MNYTRNSNVVWERLDDSALLIPPASTRAWRLDSLASTIWSSCGESGGFQRAVDAVARLTGMDRARAEDLCARFCAQLAALGLMRGSATPLLAVAARSSLGDRKSTRLNSSHSSISY